MNFTDIFKKSFLEGYADTLSTPTILIALGLTCILSLYIFFAYRLLTRQTFYNKNFNLSLFCTSIITAAIILAVQSNIVISLGMVGALSIVRFRTAIKDPMDLVFLFWSISTGIICGAGLAQIAIVLALVMTVALFALDKLPIARCSKMLLCNADSYEVEDTILSAVKKHCKSYTVKSRILSGGHLDMIIEVKPLAVNESKLVRDVAELSGVTSASLLAHDGEVTF